MSAAMMNLKSIVPDLYAASVEGTKALSETFRKPPYNKSINLHVKK